MPAIVRLRHGHVDDLTETRRLSAEPAVRGLCGPVRASRRLGFPRTFDQADGAGCVRRSDVRGLLLQVVAWRADHYPGERRQMNRRYSARSASSDAAISRARAAPAPPRVGR
jgi:hypothetical protein